MATESSNTAGAISPGQSLGTQAAGNAIAEGIHQVFARGNARFENDIARSNWQIQNEYNLPKNQLQRYLDAGMSPGAAMQAVAGIESSAGALQNPNVDSSPVQMDPLQNYFKSEHLMLDKRMNEAQVRQQEAYADWLDEQTKRTKTLLQYEQDELESRAWKNLKDADLSEANTKMAEYMLGRAKRFEVWEFRQLKETCANLVAMRGLIREQTNTEFYKQGVMASEELLNYKTAENVVQDTELKKQQTKTQEYINFEKEFDKLYRDFYSADPHAPMQTQFRQALMKGDDQAWKVIESVEKMADDGVRAATHFAKHHPMITAYGLDELQARYGKRFLETMQGVAGIVGSLFGKGLFAPNSAVAPAPNPWSLGGYWNSSY